MGSIASPRYAPCGRVRVHTVCRACAAFRSLLVPHTVSACDASALSSWDTARHPPTCLIRSNRFQACQIGQDELHTARTASRSRQRGIKLGPFERAQGGYESARHTARQRRSAAPKGNDSSTSFNAWVSSVSTPLARAHWQGRRTTAAACRGRGRSGTWGGVPLPAVTHGRSTPKRRWTQFRWGEAQVLLLGGLARLAYAHGCGAVGCPFCRCHARWELLAVLAGAGFQRGGG